MLIRLTLHGTRQQLAKVSLDTITISNSEIKCSERARNLGVIFDSELNFKAHISAICQSCFHQLRDISSIRKYLTTDAAKTIIHAFVSSRIDGCNALLYGLPQKDINRLRLVHHAAARIVSRTRKFDRITPVLKDLHWLPVEARIVFKYLVITWKAIHGLAPAYLCDLIHIDDTRSRRSNCSNILYLSLIHI